MFVVILGLCETKITQLAFLVYWILFIIYAYSHSMVWEIGRWPRNLQVNSFEWLSMQISTARKKTN